MRSSYERLQIVWCRDGTEVVNLDLHWVRGMTIESGNGVEMMTAEFRDAADMRGRVAKCHRLRSDTSTRGLGGVQRN